MPYKKARYMHIVVRKKKGLKNFRTHDIGRKGHSKRVAGKTRTGKWVTQKYLIKKSDLKKLDKKTLNLLKQIKSRHKVLKVEG